MAELAVGYLLKCVQEAFKVGTLSPNTDHCLYTLVQLSDLCILPVLHQSHDGNVISMSTWSLCLLRTYAYLYLDLFTHGLSRMFCTLSARELGGESAEQLM